MHMKTYIETEKGLFFEGTWIPKDQANSDYTNFLKLLDKGEALAVPFVPKALDWVEIKAQRNFLLSESDWTVLPDATPKPNKEAWLNYRQALRDVPQNFSTPESVVWPTKP